MEIHFTRDSVCMGDDCFDNSRDYTFKDTDLQSEIMPRIKKEHFLASVNKNNVVWVLCNADGEEILSYLTLADKIICHTKKSTIKAICGKEKTLHFRYYSSPQKRAEHILKLNNGNAENIGRSDISEEYKLCNQLG